MPIDYTDINAKTIDRWVENGWEWGVPITHDAYLRAQRGDWQVLLTPTRPVPRAWFPPLAGVRLLGLASGGGQQMPLFAAAGANCTVLDYSPRQLESERVVAARERYNIDIVRADMTRPLPFADESFDVIFHPVSNSYIRDVRHVWRECFRILKPGGILMAGLDTGINFLYDEQETEMRYTLPFDPLKDPALYEECMQNDDGVQFSHTTEEQLGGQLEAGLVLTHLFDDTNGAGPLHDHNMPAFVASRAVKPNVSQRR